MAREKHKISKIHIYKSDIKLKEPFKIAIMEQDVERIRKIRAAIGYEIPLRIDANQGWDYKTALTTVRALEQMGIQYCEQPVAFRFMVDLC